MRISGVCALDASNRLFLQSFTDGVVNNNNNIKFFIIK